MKILLFLSSILSFLIGILAFAGARGAIHETIAVSFFIISAVSFTGAGIIDSIECIGREIRKINEQK